MRKDIITNFMLINLVLFFLSCSSEPGDIPLNKVVPSPQQIEYQQMELIGFIHFSINTFTGKEWGHGDESPELFNPTELNTEQWVQAAKDAGMKQLILTAKHHDGFCLWQSKFTEYSVKNSPWKNGSGDVVREFVDACRVHGLKAGLYLSPWDRNHPDYGKPEYLVYYKNQLTELLTEYGPISEIWFDGANGGDGYYGGANEERRIDRENYYNWEDIWSYVKSLQPNILIFSDAGPDIRWIGNENGFAGETNWSMINSDTIIVGAADQNYLNTGDPDGKNWVVGECDVSIRPGWFYHESEDSLVKSPQQLADIYFKSVGRNGTLLLNLPPNKKGLISENDIQSLREFRKILNETFSRNLALGAEIKSDNIRYEHEKFSPVNIIDGDKNTYWAADDGIIKNTIELMFDQSITFDIISIQEPVRFGQRISKFTIECLINNKWETVAQGTTIGYKRLLKTENVTTGGIRFNILEINNTPAISEFGLYKSTPAEKTGDKFN